MGKLLLTLSVLVSTFSAFAQNKQVPAKKPVGKTVQPPTKKAVVAPKTNAGDGREISITLTPYKNCWVYLGCHYGKGKSIADSTWLDGNSHGVFKANTKLTGGIYFIVSPQYSIQFELLMDDVQHFSIVADSSQKDKAVITGSRENDLFKEYTKFSVVKGKYRYDLINQFPSAKTAADSTRLRTEIMKVDGEMRDYQNNFIIQHPESLLANLFSVMRRPDAPAVPVVNGKPDSTYPYRFIKSHFWDDVNFYDDRLLRTPFFEPKVDDYFKYYVSPEPDSIIKEVNFMLKMARTGKEIYPYLLTKFTNKYVNPEYMGQDEVFIYLVEEFYNKGDTILLNPASRKMIYDRYYSIVSIRLGQPAAYLALTDTLGKTRSMYDLNAKYTFVVFWDPHCGHCKETIPRIDSIYKAKWKKLGLKVYSVYLYNDAVPDWKKFINEKGLFDWVHVYQTKEAKDAEANSKQPSFRQLYDTKLTPTMYLLDDKKRIIAKQLSIEQFDQILDAKLKNPTTK
jgi:thiol-disulfide isomerase/thioredoxin